LARITIRIDDDLYARLSVQARNAGLGAATYCRNILERFEGTDPSGYHARFDEVHATAIQAFAILATSVGERSPEILQKGWAKPGASSVKGGCSIPSRTGHEHLSP
jgi:hypothetical protein